MRILPLLLLAACTSTGTVSLSDKEQGSDDTGVTGDDTGGATDDSAEDTTPPPNAWSGEWTATVEISFPDWDYMFCAGELEITVDDEGAMGGSGLCIDESNWGDREYEMFVEGEITDEGEISGVSTVLVPTWGGEFDEYNGDIEGQGGEDSLDFTWTVELNWGGGGGDAVGVAVGERQ